jgi:O-acetyl-ADP-ribose deacetylase (regulator of RNase III)
MIFEVAGDILFTDARAIVHGVAPNDPMSQGLALSLHERYPAMHKDFHHWCHQNHPKPGRAWVWGGPDIRIVNLLTQDGGYGHGARPGKATISNVKHSLRELAKIINSEGFTSLAIPRLATGVGGLSWDDVWPLIKERLGKLDVQVYVYTEYHTGKKANESRL